VDTIAQWFSNENSVDAGALAKRWDGRVWNRGVMDKARAFCILRPWLSIATAGHCPEIFKAMLTDKMGSRQRLTVAFPRPTWRTIAQIRGACARLPVPSHTPEDYLAALLCPVLQNSLKRGGAAYKANQETSLKHGKLRAKFDRLVISLHLLNTYCVAFKAARVARGFSMEGAWGHDVNPSATIPNNVVEMAYFLCAHFEETREFLDFARAGHVLPREAPPPESTQDEMGPPPVPSREQLLSFLESLRVRSWKDPDLDFLIALPIPPLFDFLRSTEHVCLGIDACALVGTMKITLATDQWFKYKSSTSTSRALGRAMGAAAIEKNLVMYVACLAARLPAALGLGVLARAAKIHGGGDPNWRFASKPVNADCHEVLDYLDIHDASTPSFQDISERNATPVEKPARAPDAQWGAVVLSDRNVVMNFL
ncbi:unnamed protein product, partial [Prorocentrum cordatum]